jgi:hypothetical protein
VRPGISNRAAKRRGLSGDVSCLGGATALQALECALRLAEIHGTFLKFRAVDLGTLIKAGVLNSRRCRNGERFRQPQMFGLETAGYSVAQR